MEDKITYTYHGAWEVAAAYDLKNGSQMRAVRRIMRRKGFDWFSTARDCACRRLYGVRKFA